MNPLPALNVIAVLVVIALSAAGGWAMRNVSAERDLAKLTADHNKQATIAADKYISAVSAIRAKEAERTATVVKEANESRALAENARRSAVRADLAARRLREHIARLVPAATAAGSDTAITDGGPPTEGAGLVLTRLFDRSDAQLRSCAAALDLSIIAGKTCERLYDSLSP